MTVLVTGGAGYIGTHTVVELVAQGYNVVVVDNFFNSKKEAINRTRHLCGTDFPFYETDICNADKLDTIFKKHSIDCVIHFAAYKSGPESVSIPLQYYSNNLLSTTTLCSVMKNNNVNKIIFSSSAAVYSTNNQMPLTEESQTGNCPNPYGWTKYMCEQVLRDTAAAENWSVALLRYFNPIGAHESGSIGEDPLGIPNNLMPLISQVAVGTRKFINVTGNDFPTNDGTCIRDYLHITDLAKGHVAAITYVEKNTGVNAFNLGLGNGTSVLDIIKAFEAASGTKINYNFAPRRPGDIAVCYSSANKAARLLNWQATKTIAQACEDSWRWQSKNPKGYDM